MALGRHRLPNRQSLNRADNLGVKSYTGINRAATEHVVFGRSMAGKLGFAAAPRSCMFRVKICGVTSVADALAVANSGADAIGLNFFSGSKRYCPPEMARQIVASLPPHVRKVGVFVNASARQICSTASDLKLDLLQLHGDEPVEFLRELGPLPIAKAFRIGGDDAGIGEYLEQCRRGRCLPRMVFVDAFSPREYGGTGATIDWAALATRRRQFAGLPFVLAGGLTPENVAQAIAAVRPWAVDTASGVEESPGRKSAEKVAAFVRAALEAFSQPRK
jgi:phosphoribosylanthranilate isomerase